MIDLATTGRLVLYAAFGASAWSVAAPLISWRRGDRRYAASGRRGLYSAAALLGLAALLLLLALFRRDFSLAYVASYSSRSLSPVYTFTSLWAGMEGSLLFWTLLTSIYAASAIAVQQRRRAELVPVATAVLGALIAVFCGLMIVAANPFAPLSPVPSDGGGLNPLLQSPFMAIHPVLLYLGFTGFSVPFAFAAAALARGRLEGRWFTSTRRWTVLAWSFLTIGIILGGAWAYNELGWGGYWAWDPVENASLLPWLVSTAFLHSVMIQERRGMLKVWNVALILGTYSLAIFGTFLTRSGILSSVHTFTESPLGKYFLPILAVIAIGSFAALGWRADKLKADRSLDSIVSREGMFLFNNLLFTAIAFAVIWGTVYPLIVEAVRGVRISVGPPFFNSVIGPIGLALLALTGIGPLVAWRRASLASLRRQLAIPLAAGAAVILALGISGVRSAGALVALGLSGFVGVATVGEFVRAARAHRVAGRTGWMRALAIAVGRNRRRYGGYLVHLGVVLVFIGIAGGAFRQYWSGTVEVGHRFSVGSYDITYREARVFPTSEKMVMMAVMDVRRGGRHLVTLTPQRNFHFAQRQPQSEIGLRTSLSEDLYLVVTQMGTDRSASVRAWVNPLVAWIWIGALVMLAGMAIILSAKPHPVATRTTAPTARAEMVKV